MSFDIKASGLGIQDIEVGTGDEAVPGKRVKVHYTGFPQPAGPTVRSWSETAAFCRQATCIGSQSSCPSARVAAHPLRGSR